MHIRPKEIQPERNSQEIPYTVLINTSAFLHDDGRGRDFD